MARNGGDVEDSSGVADDNAPRDKDLATAVGQLFELLLARLRPRGQRGATEKSGCLSSPPVFLGTRSSPVCPRPSPHYSLPHIRPAIAPHLVGAEVITQAADRTDAPVTSTRRRRHVI